MNITIRKKPRKETKQKLYKVMTIPTLLSGDPGFRHRKSNFQGWRKHVQDWMR